MSTAVITQPSSSLPAWLAGISGALPDALAAAKVVIDAGFAPKDCKGPQSIVVAAAMGNRLGLDFFTSIYGIAVINNRPSIWGDAMLAVCQNQPGWEDFKEEWTGEKYADDFTAVCSVKRKGRDWKTWEFNVKDARHAGLWEKAGPWKNTPQRMLMMRARAFALRDVFADALAGFHSREEMEDSQLVDVTSSSTVHDEPKPAKVRAVKPAKEAEKVQEGRDDVPVNDVKDPVVIMGADGPPADHPEAPFLDSRPVDIKDCVSQATALFKTEDGKRLLKDHLKAWKVEKVQELGELPDEEIARYFFKLEEIVALHIKLHGALK